MELKEIPFHWLVSLHSSESVLTVLKTLPQTGIILTLVLRMRNIIMISISMYFFFGGILLPEKKEMYHQILMSFPEILFWNYSFNPLATFWKGSPICWVDAQNRRHLVFKHYSQICKVVLWWINNESDLQSILWFLKALIIIVYRQSLFNALCMRSCAAFQG